MIFKPIHNIIVACQDFFCSQPDVQWPRPPAGKPPIAPIRPLNYPHPRPLTHRPIALPHPIFLKVHLWMEFGIPGNGEHRHVVTTPGQFPAEIETTLIGPHTFKVEIQNQYLHKPHLPWQGFSKLVSAPELS